MRAVYAAPRLRFPWTTGEFTHPQGQVMLCLACVSCVESGDRLTSATTGRGRKEKEVRSVRAKVMVFHSLRWARDRAIGPRLMKRQEHEMRWK